MAPLTALVTCRDEEANIAACLDALAWADEILVVDSGSTDRTVELARARAHRVLSHPYESPARQKNWALPQATHPWVLIVDSDERVTGALRDEIRSLLEAGPEADGYWIARKNWFFGVPIRHCGWERDRVLRLLRREVCRYDDRRVHEGVIVETGRVGELREAMEHHTYRSFDQYLEKFGRYTSWAALDLKAAGRRPTAWNLTARPLFRFVRMYVFRQGFRDGVAGLILCVLAGCSVFMKYAKLWALLRAEAGEPGVEAGEYER